MNQGVPAPGAERRRQLRQQRRRERLRQLWQLLLLSGFATGLGYGLLRQGWLLHQPSQVEITGPTRVSRDQVISAARLQFPLPLLSLSPGQLARRLSEALPVERVQVNRLMLPPRLRIELHDRQAVARAQRLTTTGLETGYVDRLGNWISARQQQGAPGSRGSLTTLVRGWQEHHRSALAAVLDWRERLGSPLLEVRFEPGGSLWLRTEKLGDIRLGPADAGLERRLAVLSHLSGQLPGRLGRSRPQSIDLSDPERPELTLPAPAGAPPADKAAGAPAGRPEQGQAPADGPTPGQNPE